MQDEVIKQKVRESYADIARQNNSCCASVSTCCGSSGLANTISKEIGYTDEEMKSVPGDANLGLGCGNPIALASLTEGEIVLDLGSGAGFDCFLAANIVGDKGRVIGVDMTPEMLDKARSNAAKGNYKNVEFRLGEIENIPAADNSIDVIISNCVINLSTDKERVFNEAFRILKPGGRLMVSDIVLLKELPDFIRDSIAAYVGCVAGAMLKDEYINVIRKVGFTEVSIIDESIFPIECMDNDPTAKAVIDKAGIAIEKVNNIANSVVSIKLSGFK
ncbi:arsenite methyltransferase [Chloroflexota bacterium]